MPDFLRRSILVIAGSAVAFVVFASAYFGGLRSSDGANYAVVARNLSEGRGLTSSMIQPGLVGVVPTSREGQASVIQAPLWPVVVAGAFWLFGPHEGVFLSVSGVLFVIVLTQAWRLGYLLTGSRGAAWFGWALAAFNPFVIGSAIAGTAAMLQASLISATLLRAVGGPLSWWGALQVGVILGFACVTRENSIFTAVAVALIWGHRLREPETGAIHPRPIRTLLTFCAVMLAVSAVPIAIEAYRKTSVIGHFDAPVLRLTFLYYTRVADQGWYFIYNHPMLKIDPMAYFGAHPGELLAKMWFQIRVSFGRDTLPCLLAFLPWFVPVISPLHMGAGLPRVLGTALLATLGLQVFVGSTSFLNFTYFFAFLPAICACIAATLVGMGRRLFSKAARGPGSALLAAAIVYGAAPLLVNVTLMALGRQPGTGDYHISRSDERALSGFILANTRAGSVLSASHAALLAWNTRRTIFQYSAHPSYTIQDNEMWRSLDEAVRIDYVLLNSLALETPDRPLPPGFAEVARLKNGELRAWLLARDDSP